MKENLYIFTYFSDTFLEPSNNLVHLGDEGIRSEELEGDPDAVKSYLDAHRSRRNNSGS